MTKAERLVSEIDGSDHFGGKKQHHAWIYEKNVHYFGIYISMYIMMTTDNFPKLVYSFINCMILKLQR